MKASNVDQLLRMLKPDDGMYGFYKLSNSDAEKLAIQGQGCSAGSLKSGGSEKNPVGEHL